MVDESKKEQDKKTKQLAAQVAASRAYWEKRGEEKILKNEKTVLKYEDKLRNAYELTKKRMQADIEAFYNRYAKNNKIDLAEARSRLSNTELKSYRNLQEEYIKSVERAKVENYSDKYVDASKELAARAYVSKMDEIIANIDYELERLAIEQQKGMSSTLRKGYKQANEASTKDFEGKLQTEVKFTAVSTKQLDKAVKTEWRGENFSDRIWKNKEKLLEQLKYLLPQEFVRGQGPKEVARKLAERMDVSYSNAVRLIRTEMNHISNQATLDTFEQAKVKQYEFAAILDEKTSTICREMNGKIFNTDDAEAGVNIPPLHPHCRSTIIPYFGDSKSSNDESET